MKVKYEASLMAMMFLSGLSGNPEVSESIRENAKKIADNLSEEMHANHAAETEQDE